MADDVSKPDSSAPDAVAAYKRLLAAVIDRRPSGTRQRLATALAKNRSFISQIANPAYPTPIPATHIEIIFEICHFSAAERRQFIEAYSRAHPKRLSPPEGGPRLKPHTIYLPDTGDAARNEALHTMVAEFVTRLARVFADPPRKEKSP